MIKYKKIATIICVMAALFFLSYTIKNSSRGMQLTMYRDGLGILGIIILIIMKTGTSLVPIISGGFVYALGFGVYTPGEAFIYLTIGNFFGAAFAYYIGAIRGMGISVRLLGKNHTQTLTIYSTKLTNRKNFILARIFLFWLDDVLNFASGIAKVHFLLYICVVMFINSAILALFYLAQIGSISFTG